MIFKHGDERVKIYQSEILLISEYLKYDEIPVEIERNGTNAPKDRLLQTISYNQQIHTNRNEMVKKKPEMIILRHKKKKIS